MNYTTRPIKNWREQADDQTVLVVATPDIADEFSGFGFMITTIGDFKAYLEDVEKAIEYNGELSLRYGNLEQPIEHVSSVEYACDVYALTPEEEAVLIKLFGSEVGTNVFPEPYFEDEDEEDDDL